MKSGLNIGTGCEDFRQTSAGGEHNPKPSTARGERRHAKRNDEQKKVAAKAWETGRSPYPRCRPKNTVGKLTGETFTMKAAA